MNSGVAENLDSKKTLVGVTITSGLTWRGLCQGPFFPELLVLDFCSRVMKTIFAIASGLCRHKVIFFKNISMYLPEFMNFSSKAKRNVLLFASV